MADGEQIFSEQEVSEIIRRAAELQERASEISSPYQPGVTHDELVRAAAEVGVSPGFLQQAIEERVRGNRTRGIAALFEEEERIVDGEIAPEDFDLILEQVRTASSRRHPVTQVGRTLRARALTGSGMARLEVNSRAGRTRIRVKPLPVWEAIGTFYPAFLITMFAGSQLAAVGASIPAVLLAGGLFGAAAMVFRYWIGKSKAAAARLADRLQGVVQSHVVEQRLSRDASGSLHDTSNAENRTTG